MSKKRIANRNYDMRKRLQNIISEYPKLYLDEIVFNENSFELEVDLFIGDYVNRVEFVDDCNLIKGQLEEQGYYCAFDDEFSYNIYRLYIII